MVVPDMTAYTSDAQMYKSDTGADTEEYTTIATADMVVRT